MIELDEKASQWTDGEIRDAIDLIYQKLHKLDSDVSALVSASSYSISFHVVDPFIIVKFLYTLLCCHPVNGLDFVFVAVSTCVILH